MGSKLFLFHRAATKPVKTRIFVPQKCAAAFSFSAACRDETVAASPAACLRQQQPLPEGQQKPMPKSLWSDRANSCPDLLNLQLERSVSLSAK